MRAVIENGLKYYILNEQWFPSVTSIIKATIGENEELRYWKHITPNWQEVALERAVTGQVIHYHLLSRYSLRSLDPPTIYLPWKQTDEWLEELAYRAELAELMWEDLELEFADCLVEETLFSHKHGFAGTPDLIETVNGQAVLLDIKTGERIWREHYLQMGGYYLLAKENGIDVQTGLIAHIHPFGDLKAELVKIKPEELNWFAGEFLGLVREFYLNRW